MEYAGFIGKIIEITTTDGLKYKGKMVELEGPEDTASGEVEFGIDFAGGITVFSQSEIVSLEVADWVSVKVDGDTGSEGGLVIADETYKDACRITLEQCERYYAITCGVYGGMVHTTFAGKDDCHQKYDAMKTELQNFLDRETTPEEESTFYDAFTSKY